jgi:hypothetical protein
VPDTLVPIVLLRVTDARKFQVKMSQGTHFCAAFTSSCVTVKGICSVVQVNVLLFLIKHQALWGKSGLRSSFILNSGPVQCIMGLFPGGKAAGTWR